MTLSDFILLDLEDKNKAALEQGTLVAKRKSEEYIFFLFQMESFYAEVCCDTTNKQINEYTVFSDTTCLQPYLENIQINDLL